MPKLQDLLADPAFVEQLNGQLARRPAARANYDPSRIVLGDVPNGAVGSYSLLDDKVRLREKLPTDMALIAIPHEFEHRSQEKYGTTMGGAFGDREPAVYLGDHRAGDEYARGVVGLGDRDTNPFDLKVAQADLERLQMEDQALRELALKDDDYFYNMQGERVKANINSSLLGDRNVAPEILRERKRFQTAVDEGNYFEPPEGGQSLVQERLYNQKTRDNRIAERILHPSRWDRLASFFAGLVGR